MYDLKINQVYNQLVGGIHTFARARRAHIFEYPRNKVGNQRELNVTAQKHMIVSSQIVMKVVPDLVLTCNEKTMRGGSQSPLQSQRDVMPFNLLIK